MPVVRELPGQKKTIHAEGTDEQFVPLTDWLPAFDLMGASFALQLRNVAGSFTAKPASQFADVLTSEPDAPSAISSGSFASADGVTHYGESYTTTEKRHVRFGVMAKNSNAESTLGQADLELCTAMKISGQHVGAATIDIHPGLTTRESSYFPVPVWVPAVGLNEVMATFVLREVGAASSLNYRLAFRSASDPCEPNSWEDLETGWTTAPVDNSTRSTTRISFGSPSPALTAVQWVQFAVAVDPQTTGCRGQIQVDVGVTYS